MREIYRLSVATAARISSRRLTMYCRWGSPREVAAPSSIHCRRLHCLLQSMVKPGVRRCNWLNASLPCSTMALVSPAASRPASKRYASTLTRPHPASHGWDKPPFLGVDRSRQATIQKYPRSSRRINSNPIPFTLYARLQDLTPSAGLGWRP